MDNKTHDPHKIMEVCMLAGKIMLRSGAETYRVEDTMVRIAASAENLVSHSYVTPTGILFSIEGREPTKFTRIVERSTDLEKVSKVNSISRQLSGGILTIDEALNRLKELENENLYFSVWFQLLAAASASGCFLIMFGGEWRDFIPAFLAGGLGYSGLLYVHYIVRIRFFAELTAAFIIGSISYCMLALHIGTELDKIIIGSVMPIVPGVLITNAIRDLMAGHLVSGLSKSAEALLTAFAIGSGIALTFALY